MVYILIRKSKNQLLILIMEANIPGTTSAKPRHKKVFGIRDKAADAREPEADPDQTLLVNKITINFDELYIAAVANRIYVYESENLKPIDVSLERAVLIFYFDA